MKKAEVKNESGASFTALEIAMLYELVADETENEESLTNRVEALSAAWRQMLRSYLTVYFDKFRDGTVGVQGGKQGVDYSNTRDKFDLIQKARRCLGLPPLTESYLENLANIANAQRGRFKTSGSSSGSSSIDAPAYW